MKAKKQESNRKSPSERETAKARETKERESERGWEREVAASGMCEWRHTKRNENPLLWKGEDRESRDDGRGGLSQGGAREREEAAPPSQGRLRERESGVENLPPDGLGSQGLPCTWKLCLRGALDSISVSLNGGDPATSLHQPSFKGIPITMYVASAL